MIVFLKVGVTQGQKMNQMFNKKNKIFQYNNKTRSLLF